MATISELENLLLANDEAPFYAPSGGLRIVVFKQFRFHKSLCIELYDALVTQGGKIKNPLTIVNTTDAGLFTRDPEALLFYNCISRFQYSPASSKTATDIRALKTIIKNPLGLRFFYQDHEFSENVSAGSLVEIQVGAILHQLQLYVNKQEQFYTLTPQLKIGDETLHPRQVKLKYEYFVLQRGVLYLAANLTIVKLLHFFSTRDTLQLHALQFKAFQQQILEKLEDRVAVVQTYIEAASKEEIEEAGLNGATERIIYLSDLGQYVIIQPVVRYGSIEVPVRSKKAIYLPNARGRLMAMERDEAYEDAFIGLLLRQHPFFHEQLEDSLPYFYLHRDRFLDEEWFLDAFEQWRVAGISIFGFNQLKGNKKNAHKPAISVQVESGLNWFNTKIKVSFGNKTATLKQLQQAVRNKNNYVQLDDGTMGVLPEAWLQRMSQFFFAAQMVGEDLITPRFHFNTIAQLYKEDELHVEVKAAILNYQQKLSEINTIELLMPPGGLQTDLRDYQLQGLSWLNFLDDQEFGGVLADDMGLGKTVQIISFIILLKEKGRSETHLIIMPTSLIFNWHAEIIRFAPCLKVLILHGTDRKKDVLDFVHYDVVLTTYGTLLSDVGILRRYNFGYVFLDESQQIKNIGSQRFQAVNMLKSRNRIAITGTPFENNTFDIYAQLSFVCPGLLGSKQYFRDTYSTPIDKFEDKKRAVELQQKVAPFILRRTKEEVAHELPDKTELVLYCPMNEAQRSIYEDYESELRNYLEGKIKDDIQRNAIHVLRGLTQLRQICNDPRLLKAEYLQEGGSAKMEALIAQVENKALQHKILIFSQFVSMLDLIRKELDKSGISYEYLTGATIKREAAVDRFQNDPQVRVFLLSLKAGGTGLNLTSASYVYLVDPWWNPSVEAQAIDRAYRIGQHSNVQAVRLICPNTVEEKMMILQASKKALSSELVQSGQSLFNTLNAEDWKQVLGG